MRGYRQKASVVANSDDAVEVGPDVRNHERVVDIDAARDGFGVSMLASYRELDQGGQIREDF